MKILIRICSICKRVIYTDGNKDDFIICPSCRYNFTQKRAIDRVNKTVNVFFYGGRLKEATTKDISSKGTRIVYSGKPLMRNSVLDFNIEGVRGKKSARVVWARRINSLSSETGLQYISASPAKRGRQLK